LFWPAPRVSAKTGFGLPELISLLLQSLLGTAPEPGDAVPFTPRQLALISQAHRAAEDNDFENASACLQRLLA
jgi:hypothetical protein